MKNLYPLCILHRDMTNLQACLVAELEKCTDPTPANIVDSIFNFIKRVTPCENLLNAQTAAATGTQTAGASQVLSVFSIVAILSTIISYSNFITMIVWNININKVLKASHSKYVTAYEKRHARIWQWYKVCNKGSCTTKQRILYLLFLFFSYIYYCTGVIALDSFKSNFMFQAKF